MDVFEAIADPRRRELLELLRSGPRSPGELAGHFDVSRPAISRHLRVLRESGLVAEVDGPPGPEGAVDGRSRRYRLDADGLDPVVRWAASFHSPIAGALDALDTEVQRTRRQRARRRPPSAATEEEQTA